MENFEEMTVLQRLKQVLKELSEPVVYVLGLVPQEYYPVTCFLAFIGIGLFLGWLF